MGTIDKQSGKTRVTVVLDDKDPGLETHCLWKRFGWLRAWWKNWWTRTL